MRAMRTSLSVVLLLLASVGVASAQDAWLLWTYVETHPGNTTIDEGFHPLLGYRSQMACEEDLKKFKQARAGQAPHPAIRFITDHCFPANIDPRMWKGK